MSERLRNELSGLIETLARYADRPTRLVIPTEDLDWLQREFAEFNLDNGYRVSMDNAAVLQHAARSAPSFEATRRYAWETKRKPVRWLLTCLGIPYRKLIERRSMKKAA